MNILIGSKPSSKGNNSATIKENALLTMWDLQADYSIVLKRLLFSRCINEDRYDIYLKEVDQVRYKHQDEFVPVLDVPSLEAKVKTALDYFQKFLQQRQVELQSVETAIEPELRIRNIYESFKLRFLEIGGTIDLNMGQLLRTQLELQLTHIAKAITDTKLRPEIREHLVESLIRDFFSNIYHILTETLEQSKKQSANG